MIIVKKPKYSFKQKIPAVKTTSTKKTGKLPDLYFLEKEKRVG